MIHDNNYYFNIKHDTDYGNSNKKVPKVPRIHQ